MKRVAIFAHFDKDDIIDDYVIYYLQGLKKVADDIIFVSDCNLPLAETKKLNGICLKIIAQKHGEYDFGSYKRGILEAKNILNNYDELIIANDSCYGPIFPFENVFKQMGQRKCDFWGLTQNKNIYPIHIQSFFVVFKKTVFLNSIFITFFEKVEKETSKTILIEKYEIGLTQTLIKAGFKKDSFFKKPFKENPMLNNKAFKLIFLEMPFIKISLLKENIFDVKNLYIWKNYCSLKLITLVENHLKRVIGTDNPTIWYYKLPYINLSILHRRFIRILLKKGVLHLKVLGATLLKVRLNRN